METLSQGKCHQLFAPVGTLVFGKWMPLLREGRSLSLLVRSCFLGTFLTPL